jgi:hypothetical protein
MVLTIEPGIYFIESLLAPWREGQFSKHFNWQKIEALNRSAVFVSKTTWWSTKTISKT